MICWFWWVMGGLWAWFLVGAIVLASIDDERPVAAALG